MAGNTTRRNARIKPIDSDYQVPPNSNSNSNSNSKSIRNHPSKSPTSSSSFKFQILLIFAIFAISSYFIYNYLIMNPGVVPTSKPMVITPFPSPKLMDLPQFQGDHKETLYWGTYRPHLYLGLRARTPKSLIAGLMWLGVKDGQYHMRHVCQDSDGLGTYGWTHHNGRDYGRQIIVDHGITLETSFVKSKVEGGGFGGDWAARIDVESEKLNLDEEALKTGHLFFYVADEGENDISLSGDMLDIHESSLLASGSREDIGGWQLHLESTNDLDVHYLGFRTPHFHNLSEYVLVNLAHQVRNFERLELPDTLGSSSNVAVFQISATFPFRADFTFVSGTDLKSSRVEERISSLSGESLTKKLGEKKIEFEDKFKNCFNLPDKVDAESVVVGKAAVANLIGGIGYFYGQSKISVPCKSGMKCDDYLLYWPAELYTAVPSRPVFPRGFLWDEGFHQLLIWRWDIRICLDILGHWLDLLNIEGWIPREQILGAEALSKVPDEFVLQHPTNGNPPTLFLVIHDLVSGMKKGQFTEAESSEISSFLDRAFVRLDAWFKWFNTTQSGKLPNSYFWHGRDNVTTRQLNPNSLSSGLDDYPRASHPSEDERHVDLRCWMLLAADCLHTVAARSKNLGPEKEYGLVAQQLSDFEILNKMHFDEAYGSYFDYGNHTERVRLRKQFIVNGNSGGQEMVREVMGMPKLQFVPHVGYVSLFPFMGKLIPPESRILEQQLNLISDKSVLWTDYGIPSLSKSSSMYMKHNTEHDPPYWRGTIWMNMNYMILSALKYYSEADGPYKLRASTIYNDLRSNIIRNVVQNYYKTGYLWEQYDQNTGKGKGVRPFTGWTSVIVLIMAESYTASWSESNL